MSNFILSSHSKPHFHLLMPDILLKLSIISLPYQVTWRDLWRLSECWEIQVKVSQFVIWCALVGMGAKWIFCGSDTIIWSDITKTLVHLCMVFKKIRLCSTSWASSAEIDVFLAKTENSEKLDFEVQPFNPNRHY